MFFITILNYITYGRYYNGRNYLGTYANHNTNLDRLLRG